MTAKISRSHLERRACVYVRQSTPGQVFEHGESTQRQYALRRRAMGLGWTDATVEIIDDDLGRSGATTDGRTGFARLVDGVVQGEVGAVFALEVSRLARSSLDWQRFLSLCAVADVVVADEHAVYDPADGDDKLLLDVKGTMSEAELRWIRLRLHGALKSHEGEPVLGHPARRAGTHGPKRDREPRAGARGRAGAVVDQHRSRRGRGVPARPGPHPR